MTATKNTEPITKRGASWVAAMVLIIAAAIAGLWLTTSHANAETPGVIGVGTKITLIGGEGGCNVATITVPTFTTAGHCGKVGDRFADANGNFVGTVVYSTTHTESVGDGQADYAVVQMAPGVIVRNEVAVRGIAAPQVGMAVFKHGHGILNAVEQHGTIIAVTQYGAVVSGMAVMPFDSGSPVIDAQGDIVGILSGSPTVIDAALNAARALGIPVPDGASVITSATVATS